MSVSTLSSHCKGPLRWTSIQQGVAVTVFRLYSSPHPFTNESLKVWTVKTRHTPSLPWPTWWCTCGPGRTRARSPTWRSRSATRRTPHCWRSAACSPGAPCTPWRGARSFGYCSSETGRRWRSHWGTRRTPGPECSRASPRARCSSWSAPPRCSCWCCSADPGRTAHCCSGLWSRPQQRSPEEMMLYILFCLIFWYLLSLPHLI